MANTLNGHSDSAPQGDKPPILCVMFIHESGHVESWKPEEIRADPGVFKAVMEEHAAAGRKPLALRGKQRAGEA